jgi:hypothetical protein
MSSRTDSAIGSGNIGIHLVVQLFSSKSNSDFLGEYFPHRLGGCHLATCSFNSGDKTYKVWPSLSSLPQTVWSLHHSRCQRMFAADILQPGRHPRRRWGMPQLEGGRGAQVPYFERVLEHEFYRFPSRSEVQDRINRCKFEERVKIGWRHESETELHVVVREKKIWW